MGLEASCLIPTNTTGSCNQVTASRGSCGGAGCFAPGGVCMEQPRDARIISAKSSDARPYRNFDPQAPMHFRSPLPTLPNCCSTEGTMQLEARYGTIEEALRMARSHVKDGEVQQAFMTYSSALEIDEENAPACDEFGQFLLSHGQLDGAEHLFNRALTLDPLNPEYCYRKGVVLQQRRLPQEAAAAFLSALEQDPRFVGALFNLGIVHRELGDHRSASEDFRRILQLDPDNHCALALLGECLSDQGDLDGAIRSLEQALRLDPTNRAARKDLSRIREAAAAEARSAPRPTRTCIKQNVQTSDDSMMGI